MKERWLWLFLFSMLVVTSPARPQEPASGSGAQQESSEQREEAETAKLEKWKWLNFAILVAALGIVVAKKAPGFFNARSEEIQKAIKDATGLKIEADFRSSEIDRRMATLDSEVQKLRDEARAAMERESERIDAETQAALERMQEHTTREIESLRRQAALGVREHAVRLATDLAVAHLRDHPENINQDALVRNFSNDVLRERQPA